MSGRAATEVVIPGLHALSVGHPGTKVPPGWAWLPLGQLAAMGTGHTPSRNVSAYWDGDIPWIGIRDARAHHGGVICSTSQKITQAGLDNSSARLLPSGTIALSRTASVGYVVQLGQSMATSQDFVTWTCGSSLDPQYLMYAIQAEGDNIRSFGEGSTHTTIYFPELKSLHIKIPPINEQRRISAKIKNLILHSRSVCSDIDRATETVLKTKQKILEKTFRDIANSCGANLEKMTEACDKVQSGGTPKNGFSESGVPFLKVYNLVGGKIDFDYKPQFIGDAIHKQESKKSICFSGDVLMNIVGPPLGKIAIVPDEIAECNINQAICLFRTSKRLENRYLYYYLLSGIPLKDIIESTRGIVGQSNISLSQCRSLEIPMININDQIRIVNRIEDQFARLERAKSETDFARSLAGQLDQAIFAKAFRGELVPQDHNDEPASILLDRIHAERAAARPAPKRGRRPRTAAGA